MNDLVATVPAFSVCLRCQWRLAQRSLRLPKRLKVASRSRLYSQLPPPGPLCPYSKRTKLPSFPTSSHAISLPKLRLAHGVAIRHLNFNEQSIHLGVNALGKPAQIRILKEKFRRKAEQVAPTDEPQESIHQAVPQAEPLADIDGTLGSLQDEKKPRALKDALTNVDQLRTSLAETLQEGGPTLQQCRSVVQQLQEGFTQTQLREHLKQHLKRSSWSPGDLECSVRAGKWSRTRWICGSTEFPETAKERLAPPSPSRTKVQYAFDLLSPEQETQAFSAKKTRMINKIIREVWKLRPFEERQQMGEVDIKLDAGYLEVLLKHNSETFEKISSTFGVQLSIAPDAPIIRLTAEYQVASGALAAIENAIAEVRFTTVPVGITRTEAANREKPGEWNAAGDEPYLRAVEDVTNTVILFEKPSREDTHVNAKVLSFSRNPRSLVDASRLLHKTRESPIRRPQGMIPTLKPPVMQAVPMDVSMAFPIHDRRVSWHRLTVGPAQRQQFEKAIKIKSMRGRKEGAEQPRSQKMIMSAADLREREQVAYATAIKKELRSVAQGFPQLAKDWQNSGPAAKTWDSGIQYAFAAHIGALLHPQSQGTRVGDFVRAGGSLMNGKSCGAKVLLNSPKLLEALEIIAPEPPQHSSELCIYLRPDNIMAKEGISPVVLPPLEIRIGVDDATRTDKLQAVQLEWKSRYYDLMLLERAADIRFEGRSILTSSAGPASVTEFLKSSNLDFWGSSKLETPEHLDIEVPWLAVQLPANKPPKPNAQRSPAPRARSSDSESSTLSGRPRESVPTRYKFQGMQYRSHRRMDFEGYPLVYTTVEGGQTGGRWMELRLEVGEAKGVGQFLADKSFREWYDVAHQLVAALPT